jgi:hypothetical protein
MMEGLKGDKITYYIDFLGKYGPILRMREEIVNSFRLAIMVHLIEKSYHVEISRLKLLIINNNNKFLNNIL